MINNQKSKINILMKTVLKRLKNVNVKWITKKLVQKFYYIDSKLRETIVSKQKLHKKLFLLESEKEFKLLKLLNYYVYYQIIANYYL